MKKNNKDKHENTRVKKENTDMGRSRRRIMKIKRETCPEAGNYEKV